MKKRLSVVIITWNEFDILNTCLSTLVPIIDFKRDEIILVDNGSIDGTVKKIQKLYPQITIIELQNNIGVAPARNIGIQKAVGTYIMTLDNDTRVLYTKMLGKIIERIFESTSNLGLLGFRLLNPDSSFQRNARRCPNILQPFAARIPYLLKFKLFNKIQSRHFMEDVNFDNETGLMMVDYVLGANQVFRKKIAESLGGYDKRIFFGPADCDFCLRIKDLGLNICLSSEVEIEHDYQRRTRKFNSITIKHIIGFYYLFIKRKRLWNLK